LFDPTDCDRRGRFCWLLVVLCAHQFEGVYWEREDWIIPRRRCRAVRSTSCLAFSNGSTGNIGYHHIQPFEFADSELQFGALPQGSSDVSRRETDDPFGQPEIALKLSSLGGNEKTGGVSPSAPSAKANKTRRTPLKQFFSRVKTVSFGHLAAKK